ncbi:MAG TPA: HDOD domain-containing protein [Janthinobacterium sp.]|nr:HDOD domain-containing protein [Janthinobacterium sp.]
MLADRQGAPAALLFDCDPGLGLAPGATLPAVVSEADFSALGGRFPCFFRAEAAAPLADALRDGGWQPLAQASLHRADTQFEHALAPAIRWVAGDWCLAPPPKAPGNNGASRALALQLVQLVAADADTHEIEALLRRDPTLSYHLLRLVNSLGMSATRRVTSFSQALLILGRQQLRRWLNLMLFAAGEGDLRSNMLLARVAVRARAMESLARELGLDKLTQEQAFMTGMFSLLGILFGLPLAEVLKPLMIGEAVLAALLSQEGELGQLLSLIAAAERGRLDSVARHLVPLQLDADVFNRIMIDANLWMLGVLKESKPHA